MRHIVIIGNGIAGITCARHIRKMSDDRITVVSAETEHFFSRTALMYIYMGHMKYEHTKPYEDFFWTKNRIELRHQYVETIDTERKNLHFADHTQITYDVLVIACGSVTQKFDWPGQDLTGVRGLYSYPDLQAMELETSGITQAVITGGGLIGVEMAEMLHTRKIPVTMLIKDDSYWASVLPKPEAALVAKQISQNGIELIYRTEIKEIIGDANQKVKQVVTSTGQTIDCQFVGIATGVTPNISFLRETPIKTAKGVLVNEFFETSCAGIYAIGDCAEFASPPAGRKKIEQVWYTGRMHGETLAKTICGNRTAYAPGPWFNSAKFFDLEYQTYGLVSGKLNEDEAYFFWQHSKKDIGFGAIYHRQQKTLKGVNSYGLRLRHACFDRWLKEALTIEQVLERLGEAVFDAEFSKDPVNEIIASYNRQTGAMVKRHKKKFSFFNRKIITE